MATLLKNSAFVCSTMVAAFFATLVLSFSAQAQLLSAESLSCVRASRGNDRLIAEVCDYSSTEYLVRVRTYRRPGLESRGQVKTEVNALYTKGEKIWNRVWISVGDGQFSAREQKRIRQLVSDAPAVLVETQTLSFLNLLSDFLAPDTSIENFDANTLPAASARVWALTVGSNAAGTWTPICEFIGQARFAQYSLPGGQAPQLSLWLVGDPASECKGRCGWGCSQTLPQHHRDQYTQECFNHDVCYSETGALLGVCKETFWAAAASYVFAPNCPR